MLNKLKNVLSGRREPNMYEAAQLLQSSEYKNETVAYVLSMLKEGKPHGSFGVSK